MERKCPVCGVLAVVSPTAQGRCGNASCPPFNDWPEYAKAEQGVVMSIETARKMGYRV